MNYGLCNLNIVPLRIEDSDCSEMVSQVLYGDLFEVLELSEKWCKIHTAPLLVIRRGARPRGHCPLLCVCYVQYHTE